MSVFRSTRPTDSQDSSGSCQGSPTGIASGSARPVAGSVSAATCAPMRGSIHGLPARTYFGCAEVRSTRRKPPASVIARNVSRFGHGRSGLTWSGVTGDTPPQSSMPASSSARHSASDTRFGGACTGTSGPSSSLVTAMVARNSSNPASGASRIAVSSLARKFWMMTSWICPNALCCLRIAMIESARSASVSPMPTRMPVV